jgi:hypothetical protein
VGVIFPAADPTNCIKFQFEACASQMFDPIEVEPKGETRNQMEWVRGCAADGAPASRTPSRLAMPNQRDLAAMDDDGMRKFFFSRIFDLVYVISKCNKVV